VVDSYARRCHLFIIESDAGMEVWYNRTAARSFPEEFMRRSSPAVPSLVRRRVPLSLERLEARDVPSAFAPEDPSEAAWIENQFRDLAQPGTNFQNEWVVSVASGQDSVTLATSFGAVQTDFVQLISAPAWQFVSGADSAMQRQTLENAMSAGQITNFFPLIYRQQEARSVPNDPLYDLQWHLKNTGQTGGTPGVDVNIEGAWDIATGKGVLIAIVDDGVQFTHPDLKSNLYVNPGDPGIPFVIKDQTDRRDNDKNGFVDDFRGWDFNGKDNNPTANLTADFHGTAVAGVAVAAGNNKLGLVGAAYDAKFTPVRLIGGATTILDDANALLYLYKSVGVSNNSYGTDGDSDLVLLSPVVKRALREGALYGRGGKGTIYVFAAGNNRLNLDNTNYSEFNNTRYGIQVTALDHNGQFAFYSTPGASLFISAPASPAGPNNPVTTLGITTLDLTGKDGYNDGTLLPGALDYTNDFGGTSSASPLVAGVVALMLEANPNLTLRDVQGILAETAVQNDPSNPEWQVNGAEFLVNPNYGFGLIDAEAAVKRALTWVNLGPEISFSTGVIDVDQAIVDNDPVGVTQTVELFSNVKTEWTTLTFTATHPFRGDLRVELTSPSGVTVVFADVHADPNADYNSYTFGTPFFRGENARGTWTIKVSDRDAIFEGTWDSFALNFYGTETTDAPISPPVETPVLPAPINGLGNFVGGETGTNPQGRPSNNVVSVAPVGTGRVDVRIAATGANRFSVTPYGAGYAGSISTAMADVNGDGTLDLITGAGPGGGPHVKVFDGFTGNELGNFFAYATNFTGGVNVAGGDVNGDGFADIIVAAGIGGGPHIRVISGKDFSELRSFMAFDPSFRGGSTVSAGDVNADGIADIFVGAGFGGGPHVYVIDGRTTRVISTFFAYDPSFRNGVFVAAGDVTGDGLADLVTGPGFGGGAHVRVFDIANGSREVRSFMATNDPTYLSGARVAARDANGDRVADITVAPGPGSGANTKVFNGVDSSVISEFATEVGAGVFVG